MKSNIKKLVTAAVVAALYVALTFAVAPFGYGAVQFRVSEALAVLPFVMPSSMFGVAIGCALANLGSPFGLPDIIIGSLASLFAGFLTSKVKNKWLAPLPPVLVNALVIPAVIAYFEVGFSATFTGTYFFYMLTIGLGQIGACYVLGIALLYSIERIPALNRLFKS